MNGLAGVWRDEGKYAQAESAYRRALAIREKAYGRSHSDVGETVRDYAELLRKAGRAREAEELLSEDVLADGAGGLREESAR